VVEDQLSAHLTRELLGRPTHHPPGWWMGMGLTGSRDDPQPGWGPTSGRTPDRALAASNRATDVDLHPKGPWAVTTMTSVACWASGLMLGGIALLGAVTATSRPG
jgi:hypothetical protein